MSGDDWEGKGGEWLHRFQVERRNLVGLRLTSLFYADLDRRLGRIGIASLQPIGRLGMNLQSLAARPLSRHDVVAERRAVLGVIGRNPILSCAISDRVRKDAMRWRLRRRVQEYIDASRWLAINGDEPMHRIRLQASVGFPSTSAQRNNANNHQRNKLKAGLHVFGHAKIHEVRGPPAKIDGVRKGRRHFTRRSNYSPGIVSPFCFVIMNAKIWPLMLSE